MMYGQLESGGVRRLNKHYQNGALFYGLNLKKSVDTIMKQKFTEVKETVSYTAYIQLVPSDRHKVKSRTKFMYTVEWFQDENQRVAGEWLPEWLYMTVSFIDEQQDRITMTRTVGRGEFNPIEAGKYTQEFVFTDLTYGEETIGLEKYKEYKNIGEYLPMPTLCTVTFSCITTPKSEYAGNQNTATCRITERIL